MNAYRLVAIALFLPALSAAEPVPLPEPIAKASEGQVECYGFDTRRKTCEYMARYARRSDGTIEGKIVAMVLKRPFVTMEFTSPVYVKSAQVCGRLSRNDYANARFVSHGKPEATDAQLALIRQRVSAVYENLFDREACTAYQDAGGNLIAKGFLDGTPTEITSPVIWVRTDDGYQVRP